MELIISENTATRLVFELDGAGHTFCNILKDELRNDAKVTIAVYDIAHPLQSKPRFIIETKGCKPKDALENAIKSLKKKNSEFLKAFEKL